MRFSQVVADAAAWIEREGRVSYRALKLEFELNDEVLEALKLELIEIRELAVDKDGKMLVWAGPKPEPSAEAPHSALRSRPSFVVGDDPYPDDLDTKAERRHLTVMFCDLVGSTALSQQLDPEDLRNVVRGYQKAAAEIISRDGGYIAQYLGDGLLVYFGYPHAHEDDARRAVHAGLEIVETIKKTRIPYPGADADQHLAVRVGIHTGLVVVGEMGGGARREQLALGETPNVAARIQASAAPNTVVASIATTRLLDRLVVLEELGTEKFDGMAEALKTSRVVRVLDEGDDDDSSSPARAGQILVGRHDELGILLRRWKQSKTGRGHTVSISGEAGTGKTALVRAIATHVVREGCTRLTFHCSPYHQNSALFPLIKNLERMFRFDPDEPADQKLEKLERLLGRFHPFDNEEVIPLFADLLSIPVAGKRYPSLNLGPEQQRQRMHEALAAWIVGAAKRRPMLLLWEDIHLADPSTLELLELSIEQTPTVPVFNVLTFRPEFSSPWLRGSHVTSITLGRLEPSQVEVMITYLSGGKTLPTRVVEEVVSKTDGVPLFVEEVTKAVLESGFIRAVDDRYELTTPSLPSLEIPATLQDMLMARLDRRPEVREVAQLGAVLGREFTYEILAALTSVDDAELLDRLEQLVEAELLYQQGQPPRATYFFRHALIQDAAYESLLHSVRQHYHRQISALFEKKFPELVAAQPEVVAHHYTEGGRIEQAIPYWLQAGERATQRSDNAEAVGHFTKGLEILAASPATPPYMQQELTMIKALGAPLMITKGWGSPDVERVFNRARELCVHLGETQQLYGVLASLWVFHLSGKTRLTDAQGLADQLLGLARDADDPTLLLQGHLATAITQFYRGELAAMREHTREGLEYYDVSRDHSLVSVGGLDVGVVGHAYDALSLWLVGYPDQARHALAKGLKLAHELGHPYTLAWALITAAIFHILEGDMQAADAQARAAIARSIEFGFAQLVAWGSILQGLQLAEQKQHEKSIAQMTQGLENYKASGLEVRLPFYLAQLAEVHRQSGTEEDGLALLDEALEISMRRGDAWYEAELHRLKGELILQSHTEQMTSPEQREAEACFQKSLEIARRQSAKSLELRTVISLAQLWRRQEKRVEARQCLSEIYNSFTEGFDTKDLQEAKALLAELD